MYYLLEPDKIYTFTLLLSSNDVESEGASEGRQIFKAYIEYAKTGKIEIGDTSTEENHQMIFNYLLAKVLKKWVMKLNMRLVFLDFL